MRRIGKSTIYLLSVDANFDGDARGRRVAVDKVGFVPCTKQEFDEKQSKGFYYITVYNNYVRHRPRREVIRLAIKALEQVLETQEPEEEECFYLRGVANHKGSGPTLTMSE